MLIERHISTILRKIKGFFPVVLVTGARQVGKTTLLSKELSDVPYFTLDDIPTLNNVKEDPVRFIDRYRPPLILDEVQYAPEIMRSIKVAVDRSGKGGEYFLIGSQQFHLMKNVSESLAGRIGILSLSGLSTREIEGDPFDLPFVPTESYYKEREATVNNADVSKMWRRIHKGSMPRLYSDVASEEYGPLGYDTDDRSDVLWTQFYSAYVKTYIERDVRALTQVGDERTFHKFLAACAARTGQLLNMASIANEAEISESTAKRWMSILETSDIIYLLQPFSMNLTSRTTKTPKLYFMDTGLAAHLCRWPTAEVLETHMSGPFFETYVVTEIIKSYRNTGVDPPIYFYRDSEKREVDLVILSGNTLYPIEIKKTMVPESRDVKHFETLKRFTSMEVAPGALICTYNRIMDMKSGDVIVPVWYI